MDYCVCPQSDRVETGWGFRLAQWSIVEYPVLIRVHYGCDRPLYGHNNPVLIYKRR